MSGGRRQKRGFRPVESEFVKIQWLKTMAKLFRYKEDELIDGVYIPAERG